MKIFDRILWALEKFQNLSGLKILQFCHEMVEECNCNRKNKESERSFLRVNFERCKIYLKKNKSRGAKKIILQKTDKKD